MYTCNIYLDMYTYVKQKHEESGSNGVSLLLITAVLEEG